MGLDGVDAVTDEAVDLRDRSRTAGACRGHRPPDQERAQAGRGAEERVAFRHDRAGRDRGSRGRTRPRGGARGTATPPTGRPSTFLTTSSRMRPSATSAPSARAAATPAAGVVGRGQGLDRGAAALEVEDGEAVDEHGVGAGRPLDRPAVAVVATRPRQRRAVGLGRVGGREHVDGPRVGGCRRLAGRAQPVERAGERELRGPQAVDEVAAPDPARLLERPQDRVDRAEPALEPFGRDRPRASGRRTARAGRATGRGAARSGSRSAASTSDQRPAASGGPRA